MRVDNNTQYTNKVYFPFHFFFKLLIKMNEKKNKIEIRLNKIIALIMTLNICVVVIN